MLDFFFRGDNSFALDFFHVEKNDHALMPTKSVVLNRIIDMLEMMQNAGVSKAIFLGSHYPASISFGYNKIIDCVYPKLQDICDFYSLCLLVDPRTILNPSYLEWDGVHPNWEGANILASLIFEAMQEGTNEI